MPRPLSWTARAGANSTFCAPACGGGCTQADHDRAQRMAAALVKLLGPDWQPRVHENLGWHYEVHTKDGRWRLIPGSVDTFFTLFVNRQGGVAAGGHYTFNIKLPERDAAHRLGGDGETVASIPPDLGDITRAITEARNAVEAEIEERRALLASVPRIGMVSHIWRADG